MDTWESFKMAGKTLAANRLRSTLTMLGIIIGNASVILMVGVGQGAQKYASQQFQSLGTDVIFVITGTDNARRNVIAPPNRLVLADADAIAEQVPTVRSVAPQINGSELAIAGNNTKRATLIGTTDSYAIVRNAEVGSGRFLSNDDIKRNARVVTLGAAIAKELFPQGNPIGQLIRIRGTSYEVIGLMSEKGAFLGTNQDDTIFMPITTMTNQLTGRTSPYGVAIQVINVSATSNDNVDAAQFQIANLLRLRHRSTDMNAEDTFTIRTQQDALEIVGNITGALTILLAAIAGISLLVGGIGIMNIMLVSVTERTQEIGLRKAIGASPSDILTQFTIEAVILSLLGGAIGTGIGISGVLLLSVVTPLQAGISIGAIALAVGVSGGIGLFFGIFPARQAARLDPIVALRSI
ncbi:ABC transporter permease [Pseudanabaena sp. FACHB-1277]|jgi:putative ABC transport system permease protein|uniref:ABC transporter permease n=1 Tax=Pseudanabaena cinerea FACHB-1277 TaxID=2949581 RepID=A0A926URL5_9CYAN|nr:ABC transporter permease [Pseudanabaena cinerea]MBD2148750.1 ABC transporter permease [Pseudanabaena cinerea FACHB-1277]